MSRARKIFFLLIDVLLLLVLATVCLIYFQFSNWPLDVHWLQEFILTNRSFGLFIFWLSLGGIAGLLITAFVVLFYPNHSNQLEIEYDQGSLCLTSKAIEGFIRSSLNQTDFIHMPKVHLKIFKKTIKVSVTGEVKRTSNLIIQNAEWVQKMEKELKELLGIQQQITIEVKLVNVAEGKTKKIKDTNSNRVQ